MLFSLVLPPPRQSLPRSSAQGLYRKFGFEEEGVIRDYAIRDGDLVDTLSMARFRRLA